MNEWSEKFNELPKETRHICAMVNLQTQLNQLEQEKRRITSAYRKSIAQVDALIGNLERTIKREEEEQS